MLLLLRRGYAVGTFHLGLPSDRPQPDKEPTNPSYVPASRLPARARLQIIKCDPAD